MAPMTFPAAAGMEAQTGGDIAMFPLSQDILLYMKFFVFFTCVAFWIRLGYRWLMHYHRLRRERFDGNG